jgi:hypothetical protein
MPVDPVAFASTGGTAALADRPRYRRDILLTPDRRFAEPSDTLVAPAWLPTVVWSASAISSWSPA